MQRLISSRINIESEKNIAGGLKLSVLDLSKSDGTGTLIAVLDDMHKGHLKLTVGLPYGSDKGFKTKQDALSVVYKILDNASIDAIKSKSNYQELKQLNEIIQKMLNSNIKYSLESAQSKARDARRISDLAQIRVALEMYYDSDGRYPQSLSSLVSKGIITLIPKDPKSSLDYGYYIDSSGNKYLLIATLENPNSAALRNDEDGKISIGNAVVNCDDPDYCLMP